MLIKNFEIAWLVLPLPKMFLSIIKKSKINYNRIAPQIPLNHQNVCIWRGMVSTIRLVHKSPDLGGWALGKARPPKIPPWPGHWAHNGPHCALYVPAKGPTRPRCETTSLMCVCVLELYMSFRLSGGFFVIFWLAISGFRKGNTFRLELDNRAAITK